MNLTLAILIVVSLNLLVGLIDLIADLKSIAPRKTWLVKEQAVDFGIALAERTKGPGDLKLRNAVDFASDYCAHHKVKTTRNELAKLVEIRLPRKPSAATTPNAT